MGSDSYGVYPKRNKERFLTETVPSGKARSLVSLRMTSEGFGMAFFETFARASVNKLLKKLR